MRKLFLNMPLAPEILHAYTARFIRTSSAQIIEALQQRLRPQVSSCLAGHRSDTARLWSTVSAWGPSLGELLAGCRISQSMNTGKRGDAFSVWGQGAYSQFHGKENDALNLHGNVVTGMVGLDYRWSASWMAGFLLAHHSDDGSFDIREESGEIQARLTGVYPYLSYAIADWKIWLSGGFGQGNAKIINDSMHGLTLRFGAQVWRGISLLGNQQRYDITEMF